MTFGMQEPFKIICKISYFLYIMYVSQKYFWFFTRFSERLRPLLCQNEVIRTNASEGIKQIHNDSNNPYLIPSPIMVLSI